MILYHLAWRNSKHFTNRANLLYEIPRHSNRNILVKTRTSMPDALEVYNYKENVFLGWMYKLNGLFCVMSS